MWLTARQSGRQVKPCWDDYWIVLKAYCAICSGRLLGIQPQRCQGLSLTLSFQHWTQWRQKVDNALNTKKIFCSAKMCTNSVLWLNVLNSRGHKSVEMDISLEIQVGMSEYFHQCLNFLSLCIYLLIFMPRKCSYIPHLLPKYTSYTSNLSIFKIKYCWWSWCSRSNEIKWL